MRYWEQNPKFENWAVSPPVYPLKSTCFQAEWNITGRQALLWASLHIWENMHSKHKASAASSRSQHYHTCALYMLRMCGAGRWVPPVFGRWSKPTLRTGCRTPTSESKAPLVVCAKRGGGHGPPPCRVHCTRILGHLSRGPARLYKGEALRQLTRQRAKP